MTAEQGANGDGRVIPSVPRSGRTPAVVLWDRTGRYYAIPVEVLACYRVADGRLPELVIGAGGDRAAGADDEIGEPRRTAVHRQYPTGGGRT